jgi:hypothetical protein
MVLCYECSANFTYAEKTRSGKFERRRVLMKYRLHSCPYSTNTIPLDGTVEWEDDCRQPSNRYTALATRHTVIHVHTRPIVVTRDPETKRIPLCTL